MSVDVQPQPQHTLSERRFPNEIFAAIIDNLSDDPFSLGNISLVCRDFVVFSQPHLFRHIDLVSGSLAGCAEAALPHKRRSQFVGILSDPRTSSLGRYVRRLDLPANATGVGKGGKSARRDHVPDTLLILQSLPFLTEVRLHIGRSEHFHAIRKYLSGQLQRLWVRGVHLRKAAHFQDFQRLLTSLTELKFLAIDDFSAHRNLVLDQTALVLPSSLRELHLTDVDNYSINLVGLGIEISYPPLLSTILVELNPNKVTWFNDYGLVRLWRSLRPVTAVTIDMDDERFWYLPPDRVAHDLNIFLRGFKQSHLEFRCSQSPALAYIFALLIASLPDSVCDISFDFDGGATDGPADCDSSLRDWDDWDQVLIHRYERGLLNRVWFRCTTRMMSWDGSSSSLDRTPDHSILDRVRKLLTQSDKAGIIEVDHSRIFFED